MRVRRNPSLTLAQLEPRRGLVSMQTRFVLGAEVERAKRELMDAVNSSDNKDSRALRLLDYPTWRVEVNGKAATLQHAEINGRIVLRLPAGTQHIAVKFVRTPDRILGIFVSVAGLLALLALFNAGGQRLLSASP